MKNKIIVISLLVCLITSLVCILRLVEIDSRVLTTDSGFDSSSGDSGSSSSSSSSSSSYYSKNQEKQNSIPLSAPLVIMISCFTIVFVYLMNLIFYYDSSNGKVDGIKENEKFIKGIVIKRTLFYGLLLLLIIIIAIINEFDLAFYFFAVSIIFFFIDVGVIHTFKSIYRYNFLSKEEKTKIKPKKMEIINKAFDIYKKVQIAWMNDDIDSVKDVLSSEMSSQYETQLSTLRFHNQKNIMKNIKFKHGEIFDISNNDDSISILVYLKVKCRDYIINNETNKVVKGDKSKVTYKYLLRFKVNNIEEKCPNCGAEIEKGGKVICSYCGSILNINSGDMILIDKKIARK